MKAITHFFNVKYKPLCLKKLSGWHSLLSFSEPLYLLVQSLQKSSILRMIAHVCKAPVVGAVVLVKSFTANKRTLIGCGVMFIGAPLAYFAYAMFDRERLFTSWYHVNHWHLFFLIRYQISQVVFLIGLYILLSKHPLAKVISFQLGFVLMGLTLNVIAESNADIWDTMDVTLWAAGVGFSITLFLLIDYLAFRKFHRADSFEARQKGLYQIADDVDPVKWKSMMMETLRQKYEFNQKF